MDRQTEVVVGLNKKRIYFLPCILTGLLLMACGIEGQGQDQPLPASTVSSTGQAEETSGPTPGEATGKTTQKGEETTEMKMTVQIGDRTFTAALEDNAAAEALAESLEHGSVTIQMSDYGGFEKVGALGTRLPASDSWTTTQAGDIVLYQESQVVIFYGSNSWSYTRLGSVDDLAGWDEALGGGEVSVAFSLEG